MMQDRMPGHYLLTKEKHGRFINALEALGDAVRQEGPVDEKTAHLIQLAAAVAIRSEGAVHSHVRRAMASGATAEEIVHAIILLTSTVGFPNVSAALSWAEDVFQGRSTDA
ncbi:carboxymuconolactone decarboxylase family protein [Thermithiobacillus tepidarius DSM 3134]|uniref:carboxymuconolactone decarboxylase family protein n=1 Tax=Thermithiobacillus tepidarius TaxID=929 RepID=UPI00040E2814|nr:carboxymuconolactone decarboxylase family protein [Thermithiobacillus tepidarius]